MAEALPFAVNHYLCPAGMAPREFMARARQAGFSGVGLTQPALDVMSTADLEETLSGLQLGVSSLNTAGFFLQEGDAAVAQAERNEQLLRQAAALGRARLNVIVGGNPAMSLSDARQLAGDRLREFAHRAADLGVQLMAEPLHHLNVRTRSCFNSIAALEPLFERVPGLVLNADLYHLWWDPDLDAVLQGRSVPLGLLQICDVALDDFLSAPRRVPLDEGCVPWKDHVRAVRANFPSVPIELELFADQLAGRHLDEILATSADALRTLLEE